MWLVFYFFSGSVERVRCVSIYLIKKKKMVLKGHSSFYLLNVGSLLSGLTDDCLFLP